MKPDAQSYICHLTPYQPGLPIELVAREYGLAAEDIIKLASNENPLGASPKALQAIQKALSEAHRYPEQHNLVQALAKRYGVEPGMIVLGNGSNDILDQIARTFLGPDREGVSSQYGFAIYQIATQSVGAKNVVASAKDYGHNLAAMLGKITPQTSVIWIANPNNPTGTFIPYTEIKEFLRQVPPEVIVVLDEAYYEYLEPEDRVGSTSWLKEYPNLILVRTFSKIYGLAGLRIGYGIATPEIAQLLNRVRHPFNANSLAIASAVAALGDYDFIKESYETNAAGREQLLKGLQQLGIECLPAYGNFITFKHADAARVNEALLRQGVIIRPLSGYGMHDWLRVTIGLRTENERFLHTLEACIGR